MHKAPELSGDPLLISGHIPLLGDGPSVYRLLLPLAPDGPDEVEESSWAACAGGVPLDSGSVLTDVLGPVVAESRHPRACVSDETLRRLLKVLTASVPREELVTFVCWRGYATDPSVGESIDLGVEQIGPWSTSDFFVSRGPLGLLAEFVERHLPVLMWSADLRMVFACPVYADSAFVADARVSIDDFKASGIEAFQVRGDGPIPVTGD